MIWFALLAILFFIVFSVLLFSWRRSIVGAVVCGVVAFVFCVVGLANYHVSFATPSGFDKQTVYEVTEEGVVRESDITYYQDENGVFYIEKNEEKFWKNFVLIPFNKREFEKVDPPVFENGNLVVGVFEESK